MLKNSQFLRLSSFNIFGYATKSPRIVPISWIPPTTRGYIKCNTDGTAHGASEIAEFVIGASEIAEFVMSLEVGSHLLLVVLLVI